MSAPAPSPVRQWLDNPFNQVIVANFADCPDCRVRAGQACSDARMVGTIAHRSRVTQGQAVLRRELIDSAG
jgi:hypothetical protein